MSILEASPPVSSAWSDYQEEVAGFFRSLGLSAVTNETVQGVRTKHAVDVVVRTSVAGFPILWLVECKAWRTAIPKEKVLTLRSIVDDVGADRGFLMAEGGYQSGALQSARSANVTLTSLADLKETLAHDLGMEQLKRLAKRLDSCSQRYWAIRKYDRIDFGLRPEVGAGGFSGDIVIKAVQHTLAQVFLGSGLPLVYDRTLAALSAWGGRWDPIDPDDPRAIETPAELFGILDMEVRELEQRLQRAEAALAARGPTDF